MEKGRRNRCFGPCISRRRSSQRGAGEIFAGSNQNRMTIPVEYRKLFQFTWLAAAGMRVKR